MGDPGPPNCDKVYGWMSGVDDVNGWRTQERQSRMAGGFITALRTACSLKCIIYFWNFPFSISGPWMNPGNRNQRK